MNACSKFAAASLCAMLVGIPAAQSDEYFPSTSLFIELGTTEGDFTVYPDNMDLEAGKLYRLVLTNPSPFHHLLTGPRFGNTALTVAILKHRQQMAPPAASLTGGVEVRPGEMAELYFVPLKEGKYTLMCEERAHAAAGMEIAVNVVR